MRTWMQFALANGSLMRGEVGNAKPSPLLHTALETYVKSYSKRDVTTQEAFEDLTGREIVDLYAQAGIPIPLSRPLSPKSVEERVYVPESILKSLLNRVASIRRNMMDENGVKLNPAEQLSDTYLRSQGVIFMSDAEQTIQNPETYVSIPRRAVQFYLSPEQVAKFTQWVPMLDTENEKVQTFSIHPNSIEASTELIVDDSWEHLVDASYPKTVVTAPASILVDA